MPSSSWRIAAGVGGDDLAPQVGVGRRDPGDVADALPGQHEVVVGDVPQVGRGERAHQLGHVRHLGDGLVVLGGVEVHDPGVTQVGEVLHPRDRPAGVVGLVGDHPRAVDEQLRHRGERAGVVRSGHRVAAHVAAGVGTALAHLAPQQPLDRGDVGDHGVGIPREAVDDHRGGRVGRHRDDDQAHRVGLGRVEDAGAQPGRDHRVAADPVAEVHGDARPG